jgi:hypothetical protein
MEMCFWINKVTIYDSTDEMTQKGLDFKQPIK